ncbi:hypothetical protein GCM10010303_40400 [Streptomyces purpurascens]|nr:hypothetical protein GCM10010303_40400 [Streptomyces purpurascens]
MLQRALTPIVPSGVPVSRVSVSYKAWSSGLPSATDPREQYEERRDDEVDAVLDEL